MTLKLLQKKSVKLHDIQHFYINLSKIPTNLKKKYLKNNLDFLYSSEIPKHLYPKKLTPLVNKNRSKSLSTFQTYVITNQSILVIIYTKYVNIQCVYTSLNIFVYLNFQKQTQ